MDTLRDKILLDKIIKKKLKIKNKKLFLKYFYF